MPLHISVTCEMNLNVSRCVKVIQWHSIADISLALETRTTTRGVRHVPWYTKVLGGTAFVIAPISTVATSEADTHRTLMALTGFTGKATATR